MGSNERGDLGWGGGTKGERVGFRSASRERMADPVSIIVRRGEKRKKSWKKMCNHFLDALVVGKKKVLSRSTLRGRKGDGGTIIRVGGGEKVEFWGGENSKEFKGAIGRTGGQLPLGRYT